MEKLIISAALTGGATIPTQSPYIPITPEEIAQEAKRAADAGAAIVHIHPRDPEQGFPTSDLKIYEEICIRIKECTDAIVCLSTGVARYLDIEQRSAGVPLLEPELASLNLGTVIIASGTKPEVEIFDLGWLTTLKELMRKKRNYPPPMWIQFVLGAMGEYPAAVDYFPHLKHAADDMLGKGAYEYSVVGIGYPNQFNMAAMAIMMGGHARVGLEDNLFIERGVLAKSNAEQVEKAVRLSGELGREIASTDEARQFLNLKGKDKVKF